MAAPPMKISELRQMRLASLWLPEVALSISGICEPMAPATVVARMLVYVCGAMIANELAIPTAMCVLFNIVVLLCGMWRIENSYLQYQVRYYTKEGGGASRCFERNSNDYEYPLYKLLVICYTSPAAWKGEYNYQILCMCSLLGVYTTLTGWNCKK